MAPSFPSQRDRVLRLFPGRVGTEVTLEWPVKIAGIALACNPAIRSCHMRHVFTRVLIWLRWPTAVLAALVPVVALASSQWPIDFYAIQGRVSAHSKFEFGGILLSVWIFNQAAVSDNCFGFNRDDRLTAPGFSHYHRWWEWSLGDYPNPSIRMLHARFPIWCLIIPIASFSWAGFHARRRMALTPGLCTRCRYPLAGAHVCPECGTAAG